MNRDEFEAVLWHLMPGAHPNLIGAILDAADTYAAGDSDHVTELRRLVLGTMAAPIPGGVRR